VTRDVIEVGPDAAPHPIEGRQVVRNARDRLDQLVGDLAQPRDIQIALGREVVVEQALRDVRRPGEVVDRDVVVRAIRERPLREREELGAPLVVVQADASSGTTPRRVPGGIWKAENSMSPVSPRPVQGGRSSPSAPSAAASSATSVPAQLTSIAAWPSPRAR